MCVCAHAVFWPHALVGKVPRCLGPRIWVLLSPLSTPWGFNFPDPLFRTQAYSPLLARLFWAGRGLTGAEHSFAACERAEHSILKYTSDRISYWFSCVLFVSEPAWKAIVQPSWTPKGPARFGLPHKRTSTLRRKKGTGPLRRGVCGRVHFLVEIRGT